MSSLVLSLLILGLLAGCTSGLSTIPGLPEAGDSAPGRRLDPNDIADAVPKAEPRSRYGNPGSYVVRGKRYRVMNSGWGYSERGIASWYGTKFHGRRTSSGETYDMYQMTAAHKSLPLPTYVRVSNLSNGRSTTVKVNDRGPFHENRIIDLSYAAATKLGILGKGTGLVQVESIDPGQPAPKQPPSAIPPPQRMTESTSPDLFVQTGAFSSRFNADRERERIVQSLQQSVRIQQASRDGQSVYRVQIGPLVSVEQVDALSGKLYRIGITNPHVVID